ncbi:glutaredoxin family protein [Bacillus sp. NTK071]|uniref:glutaredoxin family protein n=1 Tax=Bacillus sp. NTK071 TaxID=2802175 RepID=UPI001B7D90B1|nr:NrdH-redoxin [Bacillus sp. NTK071]
MKEFLSNSSIPYEEHDLSSSPHEEEDMIKQLGNRIVPGIIITVVSLLGLKRKEYKFTGFENNEKEIKSLLLENQ